ncbi:hypothetical protein [Bacillus cereus group sp. TH253LC]|uniref:hypothetical protein n=1 Tax=Bacillus cereus group sp. TH253LC TaxID=3018043 RepID=UPI0022E0E64F|nr:hypothetical protein [Bacillus cereus group sp. TH253LC]MDA1547930.1 hypothetical protein [Bacillus cereus group sp. TH253LC]
MEFNWGNTLKILDTYTQFRHYQILFDKFNLKKRSSRDDMVKVLQDTVTNIGLLGPIIPESFFEEWLALHQIDGNNYTYVYNLQESINKEKLDNLYSNRKNLVGMKLWEINPENESENINEVMPNLNDITLTGIHRNELNGSYVFSFVSPCEVSGAKQDGSNRIYKKIFFSHFVCFDDAKDCKIIFNPTSNLLNVNGVKKDKRHDWTPIANMIFEKVQEYIGTIYIKAPTWIPQALYELAEDVTSHNNPTITAASFNAQSKIVDFATNLLKEAEVDTDNEPALVNRLIQDIQLSFEVQLLENYGPSEEENSFTIFKQRSDGVTHIISVESTEDGFTSGPAAQAARRSRQDGDIDLLGVNLKKGDRVHKFLVEQGTDAYLIRGTNTFIEEEVVNIVIRRLNQYREQIQVATGKNTDDSDGTSVTQAK